MSNLSSILLNSLILENPEKKEDEISSILSADDLNYFKKENDPNFSNFNFLKNSEKIKITDFTEKSKKKIILILTKIFKNDFQIDIYNLELFELKLVIVVLLLKFPKIKNIKKIFEKKKINSNIFLKNENISNFEEFSEILKKILKKIPNYQFGKKNEEINKFLYKFTIKCLKKNFFKNEKFPIKKQKKLFFSNYFKNDAKKLNSKIQDYYDPLNIRSQRKTLNHDFIARNLSNKKFYYDFFFFLNNSFKKKYSEITLKKFQTIFKKYFSIFFDIMKKFDFDRISNFKNSRIKFPWSVNEIDSAIGKFKDKFS